MRSYPTPIALRVRLKCFLHYYLDKAADKRKRIRILTNFKTITTIDDLNDDGDNTGGGDGDNTGGGDGDGGGSGGGVTVVITERWSGSSRSQVWYETKSLPVG